MSRPWARLPELWRRLPGAPAPAPSPSRRPLVRRLPGLAPFALPGLVALLRALSLWRFLQSPLSLVQGGDMQFYHEWALRIAAGVWTDHHAFYGLPGYAFALAGVYRLLPPPTGLQVVLVAQFGAQLLLAWILWRIARRVLGSPPGTSAPLPSGAASPAAGPPSPADSSAEEPSPRNVASQLLAALVVAAWLLYVPATAFSWVLMPTIWLVLAFWFCVDRALSATGRERWGTWLGLGLLVGVVATFVATILFVLPLLAASGGRQSRAGRLRGALALLAGVLLGAAPVWGHNCFIAREPAFLSAHGGLNFWIGNYPGATGYPSIPEPLRSGQQELLEDSIHYAELAAGHPLTRPAVSRYWSQKAWAEIRRHPRRWFALLGHKAQAFCSRFEYDDLSILPLLEETGYLPRTASSGRPLPLSSFGSVALFGLVGLVWALFRGGPARWVAAAVLLHAAALLPVFITERYRLAAAPGLLLLTFYAWQEGARLLFARRWLPVAALLALSAASWSLTHLPPRVHIASMVSFNVAWAELEAAERTPRGLPRWNLLWLAAQNLQAAQADAPHNAHLWFAWGRYGSIRGDRLQAKTSYRRALENDPQFVDAYINLGIMAMEEKRWEIAERLLTRALQLRPEEAGARHLLSMIQAAQQSPAAGQGTTAPARPSSSPETSPP